ncbi:MAG: amino acid ABC transporter permease [bacterium]
MGMFFKELWLEWPALMSGVEWTLILSVSITLSGLLGGILMQYCLTHSSRTLRLFANAFVTFFIGTPLLALLFLMYYGLPTIGLGLPPFAAAFIGFTLNVTAYNARYLMSGYKAIAPAELTAAKAMGFSRRQIYLSLILPQSLRYAVPGLTSQAINNLKDTSIAFLIQCDGFLSFIQNFTSQNFLFFQGYLFAAFGYLLMVILLTLVARKIQSLTRIPGCE